MQYEQLLDDIKRIRPDTKITSQLYLDTLRTNTTLRDKFALLYTGENEIMPPKL